MTLTRAYPFSLHLCGSLEANSPVGCWCWRHSWSLTGLFEPRELIPAPQRLPNNIVHPTRHREIDSGSRPFGRAMTSVREIGGHRPPSRDGIVCV